MAICVRNGTATTALQDPGETPRTVGRSLLTVKELAHLLNMSERWVHERTRKREIPCYRFGSVLRFDASEVWSWLDKWREASVRS